MRADRLADIKVPPTLTGLLQARLDGLPRPEREALQRASVVGRLFWDDCVAELLETGAGEVVPLLAAVRERELVFRREHSAFAHCGEYIFKHALLRDVAYETVLLKQRAAFHGRVARWLEANAGERLGEYLGLIAEHYVQAGEGLKAAELLERSGYEAQRAGAYAATRRALEQALALREAAGETESPAVTRATIALGRSLVRLGDYATAEAVLTRGAAGARAVGDSEAEAEALSQMAWRFIRLGQYDQAEEAVSDALRLARSVGGAALPGVLVAGAVVAYVTGDLDKAETLAGEGLAAARTRDDLVNEMRAVNMLGNIAAGRRDLPRAAEHSRSLLAMARAAGNLSLEATALANLGDDAYRQGDYAAARSYAQAALALQRDLRELYNLVLASLNLAQAGLKLGDAGAARQGAREALTQSRALGALPLVLYGLFLSGLILAAEGRVDQALALYGLVRAHPALDDEQRLELDEELAGLGLPAEEMAAGLAAGAALDFDTVMAEILEGKW